MGLDSNTPGYVKKKRRKRERQEQRWARMAGPVTITYLPGREPGTCDTQENAGPNR